jgi:hypothetical protein
MKLPWSQRGQATSEYVALIALVAVALTLAAGLTSGGVGGAVLAGLQRGLCTVTGTACPRPGPFADELAPCPLTRSERDERLSEVIGFLRLASTGTLSAVRSSDGDVTVALANGSTAGAEAGLGAGLRAGEETIGETTRATLAATWTSGRSWSFASADAARRFVATYGSKATIGGKLVDEVRSRCSVLCDALGWRPHQELPPPDETFEEGGALAKLSEALGVAADATAEARATAVLGRRVARDGTTTWYLRLAGAAGARLGLPGLGASGDASGEAVVSYAVDARGRPTTLGVQLAARAAALGGPATADADVHVARGGGALVELQGTLDLHDPANRAAASALLDARAPAALPARLAALGRRIAVAGRIDRRLYTVSEGASGVGANVALGLELGGGFERTTSGVRLLSAETRLPGLPFLPRDDCRAA